MKIKVLLLASMLFVCTLSGQILKAQRDASALLNQAEEETTALFNEAQTDATSLYDAAQPTVTAVTNEVQAVATSLYNTVQTETTSLYDAAQPTITAITNEAQTEVSSFIAQNSEMIANARKIITLAALTLNGINLIEGSGKAEALTLLAQACSHSANFLSAANEMNEPMMRLSRLLTSLAQEFAKDPSITSVPAAAASCIVKELNREFTNNTLQKYVSNNRLLRRAVRVLSRPFIEALIDAICQSLRKLSIKDAFTFKSLCEKTLLITVEEAIGEMIAQELDNQTSSTPEADKTIQDISLKTMIRKRAR